MPLQERKLEVSIVAMRLGVSTSTVYRLIKERCLRKVNLGVSKGIRVFESSIVEFEQKRKQAEMEKW